MDPLKMYFLLKMGIFHCYVSLPEGTFRTLEPTWSSALRHELRLVLCTLHWRMFSMLDSMKSAACRTRHTSPSNCSSWSKILHAGNWEDIRYANSPSAIETNKNPTGVQGQTCLIASFFKNLECSAAPKGGWFAQLRENINSERFLVPLPPPGYL